MSTTVFILDDDDAHRRLIRRALGKLERQFSCSEANSLTAARNLFFSATPLNPVPDLAVLDLNLGDGRSTELIRELRADNRYSSIAILVLSTSSLQSDIDECMKAGASEYAIKADDLSAFTSELGEAVSKLL